MPELSVESVTSRAWRPVAGVLLTADEQAVQSDSRLYQTAVGTSGEELEQPEPLEQDPGLREGKSCR